jgi:hypothetical protein
MFNLQNFNSTDRNPLKSILICCSLFCIFLCTANAAKANTFTVTNVANSGAGSLRQAIIDANATGSPTTNVINFNIAGGVVRTVNLTTALPDITKDLTIDGTTMPGYSGVPLFELNGTSAGAAAHGLNNARGVLTVKALIINRFGGDGIHSICQLCNNGGSADVSELSVKGSYIGTDKFGVSASPNGGNGIYYQPYRPSKTTIGGNLANDRNVISGNGANGILLRRADAPEDTSFADIAIINCYIGVNVTGAAAIGNTLSGIATEDVPSVGHGLIVYVGSDLNGILGSPQTSPGDRNIISGNGANGISSVIQQVILDVKNNYIGTNAGGGIDLGNALDGVHFFSGTSLEIGGATSIEGNLISGNNGDGVDTVNNSTNILGNKIGTNAAGTAAIGNSGDGVRSNSSNTSIGGSNAGEGNVISGNANGITLEVFADTAYIFGNKIGTNASGTAALGNTINGISVKSNTVKIGLANDANSVNIIGGNGGNGILISGAADGIDIFDNFIGTNANDVNLGNGGSGVLMQNCATNVQIGAGAAVAGASNMIAYNGSDGVSVSNICLSLPTTKTTVRRNSIYSNGALGIDLGVNGITANDAGDGDSGPNGLQNFPIFIKASPAQILGTFNSAPNQNYTADLYQVPSCDASGNGEGKTLLGSVNLTTNGAGNANYNLTGFVISVGQIITATATDSAGNTSEFSPCLTVTNNPGNLAFNVAASSTSESSGVAAVTIDRLNGASGTITVDYATANGTATAGSDYTATTNTVTFLNGDTSKTIFIPITNDTQDEPAETFSITLSNPTGGAFLASPTTHVVTINDDDPPPSVSINDVSVLEGNQGTTVFTFNLSLSAPSGLSSSVNYSTANGTATAGIDYQAASGTVNFAPGEIVKPLSVTVNTDLVTELNETFFVNLSSPTNLTIADGQGIGTILDDDNPGKLAFAFATYSVAESSLNATITVSRTNGTAGAVAVNYATSNGTATAGSDYTNTFGTLIFNDGQTSASFSVPILPDTTGEASETVFLAISAPVGGAILGAQTNAVLTIFDDDGGLPANVSIGGNIVENALPLANVLVTLTGSQTATTLTDAGGNYSFSNLPAGGNFLVTPVLSGHSFEPQSLSYNNLAANIPNANFVGSTGPAARNLRVVSTNIIAGQDAMLAVELISQGNENSVGFSLNYDANLAFNPQVSLGADAGASSLLVNNSQAGRLGVILALPAGQTFAAGTRQLVKITFNTAATTLFSTPLALTDSPVIRKIADANASGLPSSYSDGVISFAQGFEADVASRPAGDGVIAVDDFTQVGRFVAGLDRPDMPVATNEFQRADDSPRGTLGDGVLAVDDFTQAGRYAAGLDARQNAGGASNLGFGIADLGLIANQPETLNSKFQINTAPRILRVVNASTSPGQQVFVSVEIDANGDENGFGFTLNYDTAKLSNPLVATGTGTAGTFLIPNTNNAGQVGVILAFAPGTTIQAGTKQLVTIRLTVAANAAGGITPLTLGDAPVIRRVSDANAAVLPTTFTGGNLNILSPTAANVSIGGRVLTANGQGISRAIISMTDASGNQRSASTNSFGYYRFAEVPAGQTYILTVISRRYSFVNSSQVVSVADDNGEINFTAEP